MIVAMYVAFAALLLRWVHVAWYHADNAEEG